MGVESSFWHWRLTRSDVRKEGITEFYLVFSLLQESEWMIRSWCWRPGGERISRSRCPRGWPKCSARLRSPLPSRPWPIWSPFSSDSFRPSRQYRFSAFIQVWFIWVKIKIIFIAIPHFVVIWPRGQIFLVSAQSAMRAVLWLFCCLI